MAIREIVWTVSDNGQIIHPTVPQDGGVQGEHNATRAVWRVGEKSVWETPTFKVYVECVDNAGNVDHTEPLQVEGGQISVLLPQAWTQYGGISTLRLVAEEEDGVVAYLVEGYARFASRQSASKKVDGLMKGRLAQMEAQMQGVAERAEVASESAVGAAQSASTYREGAQIAAQLATAAAGKAAEEVAVAVAAAATAEEAQSAAETHADSAHTMALQAAESRDVAEKSAADADERAIVAKNHAANASAAAIAAAEAAKKVGGLPEKIANQKIVNARDYGAKGDGVTDDTEAIQKALHYAEDNGLPLYIPAGNYLVSKTITTYTREEDVDKRSDRLNIFGAGHNTKITTAEGFEGDWVFYMDYNRQQGGLLWVHDFVINATVDVSGVYVREIGMKSVLEDLCINLGYLKQETDITPRAGVYCDQSTVASFQRIKVSSNIEGLDGKRPMNCGIVVRDMQSTKFVDCDIIFCGWALYFGGGANVVVENCRIDENDYGVFQHPNVPATTDHVTAYSVSPVTGEPFAGCFKGLTISKNRFEGNNRFSLYLIGNGIGDKNYMFDNELTISDNYFTGLGASTAMWQPNRVVFRKAMVFGRCDGVTVERNLFNGKPYDSTNSESQNQNISIAADVLNITIRDNVVPPFLTGGTNADGTAEAADGNKYISNTARTAWKFFNDLELNQTTRRSVGVHRNYPVQLKPNGQVDVSNSNVIDLSNGSIVTAIAVEAGADTMTSQEVTFIATGETATIKNTGSIRLAGGVDFVMGQFDTLTLQRIYLYPLGTYWVEKSRSVNRAT